MVRKRFVSKEGKAYSIFCSWGIVGEIDCDTRDIAVAGPRSWQVSRDEMRLIELSDVSTRESHFYLP